MVLLAKVLTGFHSFWGGIGLIMVILGKVPIFAIVIVLGYLSSGMALHGKGGKPAKYGAILMNVLCSLMLLGTVYSLYLPTTGRPFEPLLFGATLMFGLAGVATLMCLKHQKALAKSLNT